MPDLGRNILSGEDLGGAKVANFSTAIDTALQQNFGWDGKAIGVVHSIPYKQRILSNWILPRT